MILVVYPAAGANSPVDGYAGRGAVNETFATIRAGAGQDASVTNTNLSLYFQGSATTNQFEYMYRSFICFDTSPLTNDAVISDVTISLYGESKTNGLGEPATHIAGANLASVANVVNADYQNILRVSWGSVSYAGFNIGSYNDIVLDANGRANVNKIGVTQHSIQLSWDLNNSASGEGYAWANGAATNVSIESADETGTTKDPKMTVTYTIPPTATIAFDATSKGENTSGTSLTYAHTCTGADRILLVGVQIESGSDLITGVTYNGVAMTLIDKIVNTPTNEWAYLFYLVAPATGANNIVVSASGTTNIESCAVSYTGAKQSAQPDASAELADGGNITQSVTTVQASDWVIGYGVNDGALPSAGTGVTSRNGQTNSRIGDSNGGVTPAGSYSMTFNVAGDANNSLIIMAAIAPMPAFDPATVQTDPVDDITSVSATGNGEVTDDGGGTVSEKGIVWALTSNPTTSDNKITDGSGLGVISAAITGLAPNTLYHVRAYAINEAGTAYGADEDFTTLDCVIRGNCTLNGSPVENAKVYLIDSDDDTLVGDTLSDVSGDYEFTELDITKTYHVSGEYFDSPDMYNAKNLPFLTPVEE